MVSWKAMLTGMVMLVGTAAFAQDALRPASPLAPAPATSAMAASPSVPVTPSTGRLLDKADADTWLDGYMPYALRTADIPGAVVTIVKDGKILTTRGFGYADVAKRTPVDPERTLFRPGSISKLFTWTATMQMVEAHKLDLDADVNRYLDFKIPDYQGKPVTLRQLMTHSAGFEEAGKAVIFYNPKYDVPLDAYLKRWVPTRIFAPGTTPAYSNWGTALAAYLVQRVSGEEFDSYLDHHIFGPLGMPYATFHAPLPANLAPYMSVGYPTPGTARPFEYVGPGPAGEASVSGADMGRFMIAHLQNGELDGKRILSADTAELMHNSPVAKVNPVSLLAPLNRMELGFFETNINGREVIGHLGDTAAFHSSLHLFMKEGVGLYVSFNSPGKGGAVQGLRTGLFQDFADRYLPNIAPADGSVDARTAAEHARMMAGNWWSSRRPQSSFFSVIALLGQTKVTVGPKGELVIPSLTASGGRPREWVEVAPFVWHEKYGHDRLAAQVADGKVVRWSFDLAAPFMVYDRVPFGKSGVWIMPALYLSLAALLLTFLLWPVSALVRRHYRATLDVRGDALRARRATQLLSGLVVAVLVGWIFAFSALGDEDMGAGGLDPFLWLLQVSGAILFVGAVLISGWNLFLTWSGNRRWPAKTWSVVVFLAALVVLYVAIRFGLIAMTVNF